MTSKKKTFNHSACTNTIYICIFASENVKILLNRVKSKNTNMDMQDRPSQVSVLVCVLNKAHNYVSKFTSVITQNSEQLQAGMLPAASSTATHTHTHTQAVYIMSFSRGSSNTSLFLCPFSSLTISNLIIFPPSPPHPSFFLPHVHTHHFCSLWYGFFSFACKVSTVP